MLYHRFYCLLILAFVSTAQFLLPTSAPAESREEMRRRFLEEQLKPAETLACSASSNAILSYAEQLKAYNKHVRAQLAQQGIGIQSSQTVFEETEVTPEMVAAYARGERDIFPKKSVPAQSEAQISMPETMLPNSETRIADGTVIPKQLTFADPATVGLTLNALTNDAIRQAGNTNLDADGLPAAYAAFFDLNPSMREHYRKAKALNLGPPPIVIDPSLALQQIEQSQKARGFFAGPTEEDGAYTAQGFGPITDFFLRIRGALSRF